MDNPCGSYRRARRPLCEGQYRWPNDPEPATASRAGWSIVAVFEDAGVSGSKGRDQRPAFDKLHLAITRREIEPAARQGRANSGNSGAPPCRRISLLLDEETLVLPIIYVVPPA